jgi:hypothetical protein
MNRTKLGLLGLCAIVVGIMAMSASAAEASLGFSWVVLNAGGTALENLKAELVSEVDSKDLTLLTRIAGLAVAFSCTNFKLVGVNLELGGTLTEGGRVRFEGCEAYGKGTLEEPLKCKVHSAGTGTGIIETGQLKGSLLLHELAGGATELLTLIEPKEGTTFVAILTEGCALPEANTVNGKLSIKDGEKKAAAHLAKHLVELGPLTSLFVGVDTAEHLETSVDGSAWLSLGGEHKGLAWAGKHYVIEEPKLKLVTGLKWLVLNASGTVATELKASLVGKKDSEHLSLLTEVSGISAVLTCTNFTLSGVNLETGGKLTEGGKVVFTGCKLFKKGPLTEEYKCTVKTIGAAVGTVETGGLKGDLVLHTPVGGETKLLTRIEPVAGPTGSFVTIRFEGAECVFPEVNQLHGTLYLRDENALLHKVEHLLQGDPQSALYFGGHSTKQLEITKVDGGIWVMLGGVHVALSWSGMDP